MAFSEDVKRVDVVVLGRTRIITPAGESWESWFDGPGVFADFMLEREQPAEQERESF
uniref:type II toxin-antitoxin system VapB family antitoxin n=1 Tax=Janthinobacterium sp. HH01 TaxID=1198452 RepID=UPI0025702D69|nr:type II toxin-antitoxin system VapB family antitoxin [Janthinobacterium sp. HH01]